MRANLPGLRSLLVIVPLAVLASCSGGGGEDPRLTMDDLLDAGDTCPVDLAGTMATSGLDATDEVEAFVEHNPGDGGDGTEAQSPDQVEWVLVECVAPLDEGEVAALFMATPHPQAFNLLLPRIQADLELDTDALQGIFEQLRDSDQGQLVDLDGEMPATATRLDSQDDGSALLYVAGRDAATLSPEQAHTVAQEILEAL